MDEMDGPLYRDQRFPQIRAIARHNAETEALRGIMDLPRPSCSQASHKSHKSHSGFTFVEILAAMVFLGILVPVVVEGVSVANRASVVAERSSVAAELAENKLGELTVNNAWTTTPSGSGDFGQDWKGYRWQESQSTWEMDEMTKLTVDVFYTVQGQEHGVHLSTLVTTSTNAQTSGTNSPTTGSQLKR